MTPPCAGVNPNVQAKSLPRGGTGTAQPTLPLHQGCSPALPQPPLEAEFAKGTGMHGAGSGEGKVS